MLLSRFSLSLLKASQPFIFLPFGKEINPFILLHWPGPRKALASGLKVERNGNLCYCECWNGGYSNSWRTRPHAHRYRNCHREKATAVYSLIIRQGSRFLYPPALTLAPQGPGIWLEGRAERKPLFQFVLERGSLKLTANTPAPELAVVYPPPRKGNYNLFPICYVLQNPDCVLHFPAKVLHLTALLRLLQVFNFLPIGKETNSFILLH